MRAKAVEHGREDRDKRTSPPKQQHHMPKPSLFRCLVPITAFLLFAGGCGRSDESQRASQPAATAVLKQSWKLQAEKYRKPDLKGSFYYNQVTILQRLLNEAPPEVAQAESQRICAADVLQFSGKYDDLDKNYDSVLLQAFVENAAVRRDNHQLVALLSHHCPRYIVFSALEFCLADQWPDSIERLFDGYAAAKSPAVRQDLVFCLGRAFPSLRIRFPADDEFVMRARSWYAANRSKLKVNPKYQWLPAQPPAQPGDDTTNLFVYLSN